MQKWTLAVAAFAATITGAAVPQAAGAQRSVVVVGGPAGPGWHGWRGRRAYGPRWGGPRYYNGRGRWRGHYRYRNNYYRNCSYRYFRGRRDWRCW